MACFNEEDMKTYMTDFGHTVTVVDIGKDRELHFLQQLRSEIKNQGAVTLFTQYAPLCTLVRRGDKVQPAVQRGLVDIVVFVIKTIHEETQSVKERLEDLSDAESKYFQQALGVGIWLYYTVMEEFNYFSRVSHQINGEKKSRGKSSIAPVDNQPFAFWTKAKQTLVEALKPLLKMNLMPVFNANMNLVNKKVFYELILRSLTNCIKYGSRDIENMYNLLLDTFTHYIVHLESEDMLIHELMFNIVHSDEMARAVGRILTGLRVDKNLPNVIRKSVIRAVEVINSPEYRDSIEKGFSAFLLDIGTAFPEDIRGHCLPFILPFAESHVIAVRNAVLAIIVEILQSLKHEEIDKKKVSEEDYKDFRDKLLTYVEDFICDINSAIRIKAIAYLTSAIEKDGLLIEEVLRVASEITERLMDCAITTRKNAFNFYSTLINKEISLAKFTPTMIHEAAIKKRREFLEERIKYIAPAKEETRINICVKEFTDYISTSYMGKAIANRPLPSTMNTAEKVVEHMTQLIKSRKIWEACECFYRATIEFAEDPVFRNFHNTHTYDFYRAYIGNELGFDLARLNEHSENELLDKSVSESLESVNSREMREVLHHWHILGILSEIIADQVIPNVLMLLEKGTNTDQQESLKFFGKLALYGYKLSSSIEIQILDNVRSVSKTISASMLEPFSLIYLKGGDAESPLGFVKTLIDLCDRLGPHGRGHISFLIEDMIAVKKLHVNELKVLWDIVSLRVPNMMEKESKIALHILFVCAKADRALIKSLYEPLMEVVLGERGFQDMEFAHLGLLTIAEYIGQENKAKDTGLQAIRLPADSIIFSKIYNIIQHCLHPETRENVNEYFAEVIETGISIIYNFSISPDAMIQQLVKSSHVWFFGNAIAAAEERRAAAELRETVEGYTEIEMPEKEMLRLMVLGGAITGHHSSYHTRTILEEIKKRKTLRHIDGIPSTPTKRRLRRSFVEMNSRRKSMGSSRVEFSDTLEDSMLKAGNDELEQVVGQIGFDKEMDVLRNYMESLLTDGTIKFYWIFVQHVCRFYHKIKSARLRVATLHLFGQCMLVGPKAMGSGKPLFIKLWKSITSPDEKLEMITMAILLNDCYPNEMKECNSLILSDLSSKHKKVRLMVLDFVIFLTQTDVLKLKDILANTVLCLADESEEIREVTKNFLRECQEKDTMLHTSIPDLIFRTSDNPDVPRPKFQEIMKALLGPFKKTTELVGIVDKLVERFGNIGLEDESAEDNAYCLSLLPFGERSYKIIVDRVSLYEKYMSNEFIYGCFMKILDSARENCKSEGKKIGALEKFAERLNAAKEKYTHSTGSLAKVQF